MYFIRGFLQGAARSPCEVYGPVTYEHRVDDPGEMMLAKLFQFSKYHSLTPSETLLKPLPRPAQRTTTNASSQTVAWMLCCLRPSPC